MNFATLGDALAARRASAGALCYLEGERGERTLPFSELHARASGLLKHIQTCGAPPRSEMILLLDSNEQFIDAFWACMLGNIIAVPLAAGATDEHRLKFFRIMRKLAQPHLCTDHKIFSRLASFAAAHGLGAELGRMESATIFMDDLDDRSQPGRPHPSTPDDIAFVQYSSGSTSEPKGVALTHRNLLANIAAIARGIELDANDIGLSWMPLTHDMGLIGFHLTPFVADVSHCLMPTATFVRRPQTWLAEASRKKATILCSPNFGYRHFLKSFDPKRTADLDLSHVRILFNGAEPISVELCREFLDAMAPYGLRASAMFPVYGLAEASLAVTFPQPGAGYRTTTVDRGTLTVGATVAPAPGAQPRAVELIEVGQPVAGCEVRIAGDDSATQPENTVGHVLIRGENVCRAYYRDPEATHAAINADGWLDTGDLGFLARGTLTITGRFKEIIFVSGQNYYPPDLEAVMEKHAGIEPGKAACCGVRPAHGATDEVIAFVQFRGELAEFADTVRRVRKCVNEHVGIVVSHVIPVARLPKTTSGKIQRYLLARAYQDGEHDEVVARLHELAAQSPGASAAALSEVERNLKEICDALMTDRPPGINDNIFELGTSSLTLAQIYQRIEAVYPGQLQVTDFFDYPTIAQLARYLESRLAATQA